MHICGESLEHTQGKTTQSLCLHLEYHAQGAGTVPVRRLRVLVGIPPSLVFTVLNPTLGLHCPSRFNEVSLLRQSRHSLL